MDTLLKLAAIMGKNARTEPTKLRPAFFLAQEWSGVALYGFHLAQGMVLSDELDQDLSQLISGGIVTRDTSSDNRVTLTSSALTEQTERSVTELDGRLYAVLSCLLEESESVLEALATREFFQRNNLGNPEDRLQWFRDLPECDRERVRDLSSQPRQG